MPLKNRRLRGVYIHSTQEDQVRHVKSNKFFFKKERKRAQLRIWVKPSTKYFIKKYAPGSMQAYIEGLIEKDIRIIRREELGRGREEDLQ